MNDKLTIDRINTMHPIVRKQLINDYEFINSQLPKNCRLRLSYGLRTIKEQNDLFAMGRTATGRIVTNAKGGQSIHNYGLAFDIVMLYDLDNNGTFETAKWDLDKNFMKVVNYFKSKGWSWGGDWKKFKDAPHFEYKKDNGEAYNWRFLSSLTKDKNGYPIL
jgi:peptidoglycan LD-endopeptidase CwlK